MLEMLVSSFKCVIYFDVVYIYIYIYISSIRSYDDAKFVTLSSIH